MVQPPTDTTTGSAPADSQQYSSSNCCCLKKNLNASRPSEHPVRGENVKTFRWDHRLQILSFPGMCILLFLFLSLCRFLCVFLFCSHRQPRILLGMVEARSVNVKKTTKNTKLLLFLIFSLLVANPKKLFYTVANPARGLLNRKKRTK